MLLGMAVKLLGMAVQLLGMVVQLLGMAGQLPGMAVPLQLSQHCAPELPQLEQARGLGC